MSFHYLDNAATTRVSEAAANASLSVMREVYGNPSSVHKMGIQAENILRSSREQIAAALGCSPREIAFTSGGTESNNLALSQVLHRKRVGKHIIASSIEHSSVLEPLKWLECNGCEVSYIAPLPGGGVSLDELEGLIRPDTAMLSLMLVCNETGARLPVEDAAELFKRKNPDGLVHCDAVQGFTKQRFTPQGLGVDLLSVSSHKVHGPKGAGALYVAGGTTIVPQLRGGGHERGFRSGTEPLPAIAGFAAAVRGFMQDADRNRRVVADLAAMLNDGLRAIDGLTVIADGGCIVTFAAPRFPSEVLVRLLEQRDVIVSSGAACGRGKPSHVLTAMKVDSKLVASAVRASLSHTNTPEDVDALLNALRDIL